MLAQYNQYILVGINGDVWFDSTDSDHNPARHIIELDALTYGENRGKFRRITNLPSIKKIVRLYAGNIHMITRDNRYIMVDGDVIHIVDGIVDGYRVDKKKIFYLTVNGELRSTKDLITLTSSTLLASSVGEFYPLRLNNSYSTDHLLIKVGSEYQVINLEGNVVRSLFLSNIIRVFSDSNVDVNYTEIITYDSIINLSINGDGELVERVTSINIPNLKDISKWYILSGNQILYRSTNTPLIDNVDRLSWFQQYTEPYVVGIDQNVYDIERNVREVKIVPLNFNIVLAE